MSPAIPKVAIPPERWTATVYSTPDGSLAKSEVGKLGSMSFNSGYWSNAYMQCIGSGISHKECVAKIPDDIKFPAPGPLGQESANKELTAAITCMQEHGEYAKCESHFEGLKKLAGYEEPVKKSTTEKASEFASKAGYKLLGVPVLFVAMKYIKIK
mmetsp:Transcript_8043/g.23870  ORF Transcript_8043/g.23870 Transcript_8043/m.23870 type:complete len:156 (-) Transcript_8043:165-632(-)